MTLSDKKEIDKVLSGHGLNESFRKHIISLFEKKEKEFIKELKSKFVNGMAYTDLIIKKEIDNLTGGELI